MKNSLVLIFVTLALSAFSQKTTLSGIYTEYKRTLWNGDDGSQYTINGKPFEPDMQLVFHEDSAVVYTGNTKRKETFTVEKDTLILKLSFGTTNPRVIQTKYIILENSEELILREFKQGLDKDHYIRKFYYKKSTSLKNDYLKKIDYDIFTVVQEMPSFPGGLEEMKKFISEGVSNSKLKGPEKIFFKLLISPEGKISNIDLLTTPKAEYVEEAVKIVRKFPDFSPGRQNGRAVYVYYNFPVFFK